jgi:hypothetical protein
MQFLKKMFSTQWCAMLLLLVQPCQCNRYFMHLLRTNIARVS